MSTSEPTQGQVERLLSQKIQNFYSKNVGQRPPTAICQLFDEKVTVILGQTVSTAEQALIDAGQEELASKYRRELHEAVKPQLKELIEEILATQVVTVLMDADLSSGFSSINAILGDYPSVRDLDKVPKVDRKKLNNSNGKRSEARK